MKHTHLFIALSLLLFSCGGGSEAEEPVVPKENTAPTVPVLVYPLNNTVCIDNTIVFEWVKSTDLENDIISYEIEISENSSFSPILLTERSSSGSKLITLEKGKAFYWRLKAVDNKSLSSDYSSVSNFLTEGDGVSNHLPFAPSLVSPLLNSQINGTSTTLSWSATDVDEDALTFDVYLDTNPNPTTKVSENQTESTYNATDLVANTTYYFKIVVKDDKGGVSIGQVWSFITS